MAGSNHRAAYRSYQTDIAGATTHDVIHYVSAPAMRAFVDRVAAMNKTRAASACNVYLSSGGALYHLATLTLTAQSTWYSAQVQTWLYEGEQIVFSFSSVVAADALTTAACGSQELER